MNTLPRDIGLYLHIPFCRQRCHFCAFYLEASKAERIDSFVHALEKEIAIYRRGQSMGDRMLRSIYFGGGTPTALAAERLSAILARLRTAFPALPELEVTVEAHPSTVGIDDLRALAEAGFNRISFGAESMNEGDFALIGRPGTVEDTTQTVRESRIAGFTNINLDLMYGLPGQTLESWTETVQALLALEPSHISCYALTIEEGTRLAYDIARGIVPAPDDSLQVDMESAAESLLTDAGFERYEISNYAKPGYASRHNTLYWTDGDYLGLGPSAQSYVDGVRFGNVADLTAYVDHLSRGILPVVERTVLSESEQARDALVFGLRLVKGVPLRAGPHGSHQNPHRRAVDQLIQRGLLEVEDDRIRLTPTGRRYADSVAEELF
jgi:oxygen-independent coproporphyrinogen-3 oxidase